MKKLYFIFLFFFSLTSFAQCYTSVYSNGQFKIARRTDGTLWAKGINTYGCFGQGLTVTSSNEFIQIGTDTDWSDNFSASNSGSRVFARKNNGTIWYWGRDFVPNEEVIVEPMQFGSDSNWAQVKQGISVIYGIKTDGTLWSWGFAGNSCELGQGSFNTDAIYQYTPIQIGTNTNWKDIFPTTSGALLLKTNGTLWAFGNDFHSLYSPSPNGDNCTVHQLGTDNDWKIISTGGAYSVYGIKNNGTLWNWGYIQNYTPGMFYFDIVNPATQVGVDSDWKSVEVTTISYMMLKENGTRWGYGTNFSQQLGSLPTGWIPNIIQLDTATDWEKVGMFYAIKQNHSLYEWTYSSSNPSYPTPTLLGTQCLLSNNTINEEVISIFPNPTENNLTIKYSKNINNYSVNITNNLGQILYNQYFVNNYNDLNIDFSSFQTGVYYLNIIGEHYNYQNKIIKK